MSKLQSYNVCSSLSIHNYLQTMVRNFNRFGFCYYGTISKHYFECCVIYELIILSKLLIRTIYCNSSSNIPNINKQNKNLIYLMLVLNIFLKNRLNLIEDINYIQESFIRFYFRASLEFIFVGLLNCGLWNLVRAVRPQFTCPAFHLSAFICVSISLSLWVSLSLYVFLYMFFSICFSDFFVEKVNAKNKISPILEENFSLPQYWAIRALNSAKTAI